MDDTPTHLSFLAHQGGWDEILSVAGPLVVFGWLLFVARKRARARKQASAVNSQGN